MAIVETEGCLEGNDISWHECRLDGRGRAIRLWPGGAEPSFLANECRQMAAITPRGGKGTEVRSSRRWTALVPWRRSERSLTLSIPGCFDLNATRGIEAETYCAVGWTFPAARSMLVDPSLPAYLWKAGDAPPEIEALNAGEEASPWVLYLPEESVSAWGSHWPDLSALPTFDPKEVRLQAGSGRLWLLAF